MNKGYDVLVSPEVADAGMAGMRHGHRCCGGCCDMRRAVIIVNIVNCLIAAYGVISMAVIAKMIDNGSFPSVDTEATIEDNVDMLRTVEHILLIVLFIKIPLSAAGMYGAAKFMVAPIYVSLGMYILEFVLNLFTLSPSCVIQLLFAYPHFFFIKQVREGIMSEENYVLEQHSCCCV